MRYGNWSVAFGVWHVVCNMQYVAWICDISYVVCGMARGVWHFVFGMWYVA